ncbi:hypothetical protein ACIQ7Q_27825 [Streptomyces sp. NPDC096176]|uniref:hypothetical protein n=1 Tax=Streptomyces sp. NPDC096176 TaxID=3366079 RepID=UPI0037FC2A2C
MSDYYDLFLAVDLSPDLSEPALEEVRWLLGQAEMPSAPRSADWETWGYPWQVFAGGSASHAFGGADVSQLVPAVDRPDRDGVVPWALTVRICVHEDEFGVVMEVVEWLLRQATTEGWVGFVRDTALEDIQHIVRQPGGFDLVDVRSAEKRFQISWS